MSNTILSRPSIASLSGEDIDRILTILFIESVPDFTETGTLWRLSPITTAKTLRVLFKDFFRLRLVCRELNNRIKYLALVWTILPLAQMDQENVRRSLRRSKGCKLKVIVSDLRSCSNLDVVLEKPFHSNRIETLYIDLPASHWPANSMLMQLHQFPSLNSIFFSSRGIEDEWEEDEEVGAWIWGNTGGNGVIGAVAAGNVVSWGVPQPTPPPPPPLIAKRHRTQLSYKVGIAELGRIPAKVLCIRDSAFGFRYFTPPFQLTTLQVHQGYVTSTGSFMLNLVDFDRALQSIPSLRELELWNVNAYGPRGLKPIVRSNIRYVALRGPHESIAAVTHYLRECDTDIFVVEISDTFHGAPSVVSADAMSSVDAFANRHTPSAVGVFLNVPEDGADRTTVDLLLASQSGAIMSLKLPLSQARAFHDILHKHTSAGMTLSFDVTAGDDVGDAVNDVFNHHLHLATFGSFHLCVDDRHVHDILSAIRPYRPREARDIIWFHGINRQLSRARVEREHPEWIPYVKAVDADDRQSESGPSPTWASQVDKPLFSPSVPAMHEHLMTMMKYTD